MRIYCRATTPVGRWVAQALGEDEPLVGPGEAWEGALLFVSDARPLIAFCREHLEKKRNCALLAAVPYSVWEGQTGSPQACARAGGVCAAVRRLAREYAGQNIRINCLRYGWVQGQSLCADALENVALARAAHPRELARAARFFLGEGSSFMTGQTIDVNGGRLY